MRIGVLSDAHGNFIGTDLCINFLNSQKVDKIIFLGDAVGYYPDADKVIELLFENHATMIMGNHDAMLLGKLPLDEKRDEIYKIENTKRAIKQSNLKRLEAIALSYQLNVDNKNLLFVHGSPWNPLEEYVYPNSELRKFLDVPFDLIFMGHTHHPFIKILESKTIVNVGSCGSPRDVGNMASCCVYDTEKNMCKIYRLEMDIKSIKNEYNEKADERVLALLDRKQDTYFGEDSKRNEL